MKEMIKKSLGFWNNYWGDSVFPYLLAIALLYLLIFKRKKKTTRYVLGYVFLALFLFFFPYTAKIIQKCIGENVYWRVLWLVPSTPVIALAMTEFIRGRKAVLQPVLLVLCTAVIVLGGKEFYTEGYYHKVNNYQQVPDVVAGICELAKQDAGGEKFLLVADEYVSSYIRVYDPSIYLPFGRRGSGGAIGTRRQLYFETMHRHLIIQVLRSSEKEQMQLSCGKDPERTAEKRTGSLSLSGTWSDRRVQRLSSG